MGSEDLRASHADREQVIGALKVAFVQGMLAKDEFDERVGLAFAARTYGDLAALTADLPAQPITAQPPTPARAAGEQPVLRPGKAIAVATTLYAGVWAFTFLPSWPTNSEGEPAAAIVTLFVSTTLIYLLVLVIAVGYAIAGRRERRTGGQSPRPPAPGTGGPPSWRLPPVGPEQPSTPVCRPSDESLARSLGFDQHARLSTHIHPSSLVTLQLVATASRPLGTSADVAWWASSLSAR